MRGAFAEVARAEIEQLQHRQSQIEARRHDVGAPPADPVALAEIGARFDSAYVAVGAGGAPPPLPSETRFSYRRRLAGGIQHFSPDWRHTHLYRLPAAVMNAAEAAILTDTIAAVGDHTRGNPDGSLRRIDSVTAAGHQIVEWAGSPRAWL